jgi:hypothetical protein
VVAQVLARLHFDKPEWLAILGGRKMLIESPLIQEIGAEFARAERAKSLLDTLKARFGSVTPTITAGVEQVKDVEKLRALTKQAVKCKDLQAFEEALLKALPAPPPASTRGKRRQRKPAE